MAFADGNDLNGFLRDSVNGVWPSTPHANGVMQRRHPRKAVTASENASAFKTSWHDHE